MGIIKKMHYKSKLILCYLVLVSFPLILCFTLLYQSIVKPVQESAVNAIDQRMEQEITIINSKAEKIHHVSYLLSTNTVVNKFFLPRYYSDLDLIETLNNDIYPLLSWLEASNPEVSLYHFFTDNPYIPESRFLHQYGEYEQELWMQEMEQTIFEKGWYLEGCHPERSYSYGSSDGTQNVYSLFYPLLTTHNYLEVCVKPSVFFGGRETAPVMNSGFLAGVDREGTVFSDKLSSELRCALEELLHEETYLSEEPSVAFTAALDQKEYYIRIKKIEALDSWLLCAVPNVEMIGPVLRAQNSFALVILSALIGILLLSYLLSSLLIRRINTIIGAVHKIQEGDFHVTIPADGNDEIDQLASDINYMSYKINELINREYKAKMLQKETELSALQAQINPHFLFNILDTFKMIAIIHDLDDFSDSIAALGNLMRYNIAPTSYHCSLEHELQIIKDYINIQNLLLNNRVTLLLSVPKDSLHFEIPNFILQPIIENAFAHGFEDKLDKLIIKVTIYQEEANTIIRIEDNGTGISVEQQEALRMSMLASIDNPEIIPTGKSIGLMNVNLRLYLLYHGAYTIEISSSGLGGACITLSLPFHIPLYVQKGDIIS